MHVHLVIPNSHDGLLSISKISIIKILIIFGGGGSNIYIFVYQNSLLLFYRWNANKNILLKYYTYYSVIRSLYDQQLALTSVCYRSTLYK